MSKEIYNIFTVLEALSDGIYLTDHHGITLYVNSSYEKMTGISRNEVVGKNVVDLEAQGVFSPVANPSVIKTGKSVTLMQNNKLGHKVVVTGYPIRSNQSNKLIGAITIVRNFTILEKMRQEIEYQRTLIQRYQEVETLRGKQEKQIILRSDKMQKTVALAYRLANVDAPVLITGETGTGKELVANILHNHGPRKDKPMLSLNCAAIPEALLESELFGYAPGAFTGANLRGKAGVFELTDQGTLLLDEIGELPLHMQVKLLRVLQEQEIMRIGSSKVTKVNVRIIAATHRNLEEMVDAGQFRQDLLYRLRVATIDIPPLRERREDIEPLVEYFLEGFNHKHKRELQIRADARQIMKQYKWPGNVRELENVIHSLIVAFPDGEVTAADLPNFLVRSVTQDMADSRLSELIDNQQRSLHDILDDVEMKVIKYYMDRYSNNASQVADVLGCDRTTIQRKLKKHKMPQ